MIDFILTAVVFVLIFSALVLIHEFGHFFVARKAGIKVEEFGFGLPPRIWGKKRGETLYSINAIPFGGFVRLLGEDGDLAKKVRNKRSFASKPLRARALVIVAGVLMNYVLAWLLLTIGFAVGMQPLLLNGDDVFAGIESGVVQIRPGIIIKSVAEGGPAAMAGLKEGDRILAFNGIEPSDSEEIKGFLNSGKPVTLNIQRNGVVYNANITPNQDKSLGLTFYDVIYLPRVAVHAVKDGSNAAKAGIKQGDVILAINGDPVYYVDDFSSRLGERADLELTIDTGLSLETVKYTLPNRELVLVSYVFANTPAAKAGLQKGDIIKSLDGLNLLTPEDIVVYTKQHAGQAIKYELERGGKSISVDVTPDKFGLIGVSLSRIYAYDNAELSVYGTDAATSVKKINDVRFPFWVAPMKAFEESGRLGVLTVQMFGDVIKSIFTKFAVPEGVAGVVGIAQMTHVFVQEGVMSLLRFVALLSLSLAMINILPIPALDGGKMLFILIEALSGRRVNQKFESIVHLIGFVLLMVLIAVVTYSDIARILAG